MMLINNIKVLSYSLLDVFFPVGTVYLDYSGVSPSSLYGGSWTKRNASLSTNVYGSYFIRGKGANSTYTGSQVSSFAPTYVSTPTLLSGTQIGCPAITVTTGSGTLDHSHAPNNYNNFATATTATWSRGTMTSNSSSSYDIVACKSSNSSYASYMTVNNSTAAATKTHTHHAPFLYQPQIESSYTGHTHSVTTSGSVTQHGSPAQYTVNIWVRTS